MKSIPSYTATTRRGKQFTVVALTEATAWQQANERYPNQIVSLRDNARLNTPPLHPGLEIGQAAAPPS